MSKYIGCECGAEVLKVEYDDECKVFYLGIFQLNRRHYWWNKLRHIWHILRKGEPYGDEIVLRKNSALELVDYINLHSKEIK